jgi:acyl carrier protein
LQPTIDKIRELIDGVMVDEFEVDRELLRPDALLVKDLDLDSLDGVDLVVALEKTFGCRIPEERAKEIRTLGDVYDSISELLQAAA